jgi:hypothetical protein
VRFDQRFKYIGSQKFILYDRAQVEQHFFVHADEQRRIKRMYMLQFERRNLDRDLERALQILK